MFPDSVLRVQSEEAKTKISKNRSGRTAWNAGVAASAEQKEKQSRSMIEKYKSDYLHPMLNVTLSDQTKQKISEANTGKSLTNEQKEKRNKSLELYREGLNYVPPMLGKKHSAEAKEKISISVKEASKEITKKFIDEIFEKATKQKLRIDSVDDNYWISMTCLSCNSSFVRTRQIFRNSYAKSSEICSICFPKDKGTSNKERDLFNEIKLIAPDAIANDRTILKGKELDIFIPSKNIGVEFTGIYWHSELVSSSPHHLLWKHQYASKVGVQVITIFEDEWDTKRDLVLSRLSSILGRSTIKVNARECVLKEVPVAERKKFLNQNHLQGQDTSSVALGLFHNNELLSLGTFKKTSISKGGDGSSWELSRFCSKLNTSVRGGFSKIIKHFQQSYNSKKLPLISYADRRWSDGALYKAAGFSFVGVSKPSYWYFKIGTCARLHRSAYMKHRLVKTEEDKLLTEWTLAQRAGLNRIWDCGTTKWILD